MILPYMHNGDIKSFLKSKREGILYVNEAGLPEVCNYMWYISVLLIVYIDTIGSE